jgi:hypothetical protein
MIDRGLSYMKNFAEDLTWPMRAAALAAGAGLVAGLVYFAGQAMWWIIGGIVVVILILVIFELVRRYRIQKQGKTFSQTLKAMLAKQPRGASAEDRGRLEQLRERFEEGMETFRAAGRSVYDVPWYMLIGEPGSGKTEAIRRSNISFPPGIQDPFQGSGGTVNMDWWFANDAVIIDTAGRIFIEEVEAGQTAEWDQLLNLLKAFRKRCPINGVLLVLPAAAPPTEGDAPAATGGLIDDTVEQVEARATRFVERIGRIQQRLGVRFPVFVLVTMCDRILGFREFFDDMTDVNDQHQMLGWSNPAPLDEPYNANAVQQALASVSTRLRRHRAMKMRDPVNTQDASRRRADEVDSMFAFPDAFENVFPQLRSYLDKLFTKTAWYQPPFFRGLYFTSSMQKGAAIDKALAELVGADAGELGVGGAFRADRAYFIKDVIEDKVFKERGLVTDAADAEGSRRKTIRLLWGAGAVAAVLMLLSMVWGVVCTSRWQRDNLEPWKNARLAYHEDGPERDHPPFDGRTAVLQRDIGAAVPGYADLPRGQERFGGSTADIQERLLTKLQGATSGLMCRLFGANFGESTSRAQATLFARAVTRPIATAALEQLSAAEGVEPVSDPGGRATIELVRWATLAMGGTPSGLEGNITDSVLIDFSKVASVVDVQDQSAEQWNTDIGRFNEVFRKTYERLSAEDPSGERLRDWLGFAMGLNDPDDPELASQRRAMLASAVGRAIDSMGEGASPESPYGRLIALDSAMTDYMQTEQALWSVAAAQRTVGSQEEAERLKGVWADEYARLQGDHERIEANLPALREASPSGTVDRTFAKSVVNKRQTEVGAAFAGMLSALPPAPAEGEDPASLGEDSEYLAGLRTEVADGQSGFQTGFQSGAGEVLGRVDQWSPHARALGDDRRSAVERRHVAYTEASRRLLRDLSDEELLYLARIARILDDLDADWATAEDEIRTALAPLRDQPALQPSVASTEQAVDFAYTLSAGITAQAASEKALQAGWPTIEELRETFAADQRSMPAPANSALAAAGGAQAIDPAYSVAAAEALADALAMMEGMGADNGEGTGSALLNPAGVSEALRAVSGARDEYVRAYVDRWRAVMDQGVTIPVHPTWNDYRTTVIATIRPVSDAATVADFRNRIVSAAGPLRTLPEAGSPGARAAQQFIAMVDAAQQAEINLQATYPLERQLNLLTDYLTRLPPTVSEARSRLLRDVTAPEAPQIFGVLKNAQREIAGAGEHRFETRYTTELLAAAMDAIRAETRADLVTQYESFAQANRGLFPFASIEGVPVAEVTNAPVAKPTELGNFGGIDSLLGGARSEQDSAAVAAYPPSLRDAIDRLANLLDISERERAVKLLAMRNALAGNIPSRLDLTATITLPAQPQSHRPIAVQCLRIDRTDGSRAPVRYFRFDADVPFTEQGVDQPIRFNASEGLSLDLLNTENDANPQFAFNLGDWGVLKLLRVFDATPVAAPGAPATEWEVRVPLADGGAQYVLLKVTFSRPVPPLDRWPDF